jgi:hypothetical protein
MRSRSAAVLLKIRGFAVRRGMGAVSVAEAWRRPDLAGLRIVLAQRWGRLYGIFRRGEEIEIPVIGVWLPVTGIRLWLMESWLAIIGGWLWFTESRIPVIGNWFPVTENQLSVIGSWFSVIGIWISMTGMQL